MAKKNIDEALLQQMIAGNIPMKEDQTSVSVEDHIIKSEEDYTIFLERKFIENRRSVYISEENYEEIFKTVRLFGNKINVSCVVNNILTQHMSMYRDSIDALRSALLEKLKS